VSGVARISYSDKHQASDVLTLRQLRYFVAVAQELHFRRAATRLHMTQPALSEQIRQLEKVLEVRLLERDRRHVELTDAGAGFLADCRRILTDVDGAVAVARRRASETRPLRVAYAPTIDWWFLPLLLDRLTEQAPPCSYAWLPRAEELRADDILGGHIDVALTRHFEPVPGLEYEALLWERPGIYVSSTDPLAKLQTVSLPMLEGYRVRTFLRDAAPARFEAFSRDINAANVTVDLDATLGFWRGQTTRDVANGDYIVMGYSTAGPILPDIAVIPLSEEVAPIPLALTWRREDESPATVHLAKIAREVAQRCEIPRRVFRKG
jgi:DNA-binding transcriptional LysR family regulator